LTIFIIELSALHVLELGSMKDNKDEPKATMCKQKRILLLCYLHIDERMMRNEVAYFTRSKALPKATENWVIILVWVGPFFTVTPPLPSIWKFLHFQV
jgi:hypothetical protein